MSSLEVPRRLLGVLLLLQSTKGKIRLADLRRSFSEYDTPNPESGRRKFERDKKALAQLGVRIEHLGHEEDYAYRLDLESSFLSQPVELDASEMVLLAGLASEALDDEVLPHQTALRVALSKLGVIPGRSPGHLLVRHPVRDPEEVTDEMIDLLAEAVLANKRVSFGYAKASGAESEREVEPYGLFLKHGHWYLCGRCLRADAIRVFRLSRAWNLEINTRAPATPDFRVPEGFRLLDHSALNPVRFSVHDPITVEVQVDDDVLHLARTMWGEPRDSQANVFDVETSNADAVMDQVLSLWSCAEILGPKDVRERMRAMLLAVLEAHGESV